MNIDVSEVVLFGLNTEFLVCKKELLDDKWHIYLREIKTGIAQNVILWVDDEIIRDCYNTNYFTLCDA